MAINASVALLLEDEPLIAMDLENALGAAGFDVSTAMSSADARAWLDQNLPDIVIVDIELRDGPCTEVVRRLIRQNISFVVYSGDPPGLHTDTPFAEGVWVAKPAGGDEVVRATRTAMAASLIG